MALLTKPKEAHTRHWSDWTGFACYFGLAGLIAWRAPRFAIILLPAIVHELFVAVSFLLRRPARSRLSGLGPQLAGYGGSFLIPLFAAVAAQCKPQWLKMTAGANLTALAIFVWAAGTVLAFVTLWHLRGSFSLMPQARQPVFSGPYRAARHPMYLAYMLQYGAIVTTHLSLPFLLVFLLWLGLVLARIHYEEKVLLAEFPDYEIYRRSVAMFGICLDYRARTASITAPNHTGAMRGGPGCY
jgi:protein-S-isoprenylcysteine O-methyltransferase Ste14